MNTRFTARLDAAADQVSMFADALEPYVESVSMYEVTPDGAEWRIEAVLPDRYDRQGLEAAIALAAAANGVTGPALTIAPLQDVDWLSRIAADFPPFRIGKVFVHGSHVAPSIGNGPIRLRIDAGTAFGSGEHQTTQGCLMALQDLAKRRKHFGRILDMGCGSGILALASAHLWSANIVAVDIDPEAVRVTRENARINGIVRDFQAGAGNGYRASILARAEPFDLIVSNILARPLRAMAPQLARALEPGGYAILSGLLRRQQGAVLAAHRAQGLHLVCRYPVGEWQTLVLAK